MQAAGDFSLPVHDPHRNSRLVSHRAIKPPKKEDRLTSSKVIPLPKVLSTLRPPFFLRSRELESLRQDLAVGCRGRAVRGTRFRRWAAERLRAFRAFTEFSTESVKIVWINALAM